MRNRSSVASVPNITIRVAGKLFQSHLSYLDQLVQTAVACQLWVLLDLEKISEMDRAGLFYLMRGEGRLFDLISCPDSIRERMIDVAFRAA